MAIFVSGTELSGGGGSADFVKIGTFSKDASANTITCASIFSSTYDSYLLKLQDISSGVATTGSSMPSLTPYGSSVTGVACYYGIEPTKQSFGWFYSQSSATDYVNAQSGTGSFLLGTGGEYPQTAQGMTLNGEVWIDYKSSNSSHMAIKTDIISGSNNNTEMAKRVKVFGYAKMTGGAAEKITFGPGTGTLSTASKVVVYGLKS